MRAASVARACIALTVKHFMLKSPSYLKLKCKKQPNLHQECKFKTEPVWMWRGLDRCSGLTLINIPYKNTPHADIQSTNIVSTNILHTNIESNGRRRAFAPCEAELRLGSALTGQLDALWRRNTLFGPLSDLVRAHVASDEETR